MSSPLLIFPGRDRCSEREGVHGKGNAIVPRQEKNNHFPKTNCNRLLDVARETYKENVGDIFALNRTLAETHGLPLALLYQESGFVFTLKKSEIEGELPRGFINASLKKAKWTFSSMDLVRFAPLVTSLKIEQGLDKNECKNEGRAG
jgi:hypothetical protein